MARTAWGTRGSGFEGVSRAFGALVLFAASACGGGSSEPATGALDPPGDHGHGDGQPRVVSTPIRSGDAVPIFPVPIGGGNPNQSVPNFPGIPWEIIRLLPDAAAFQPMEIVFHTGVRSAATGNEPHQLDTSPENPWLDWRMDLMLESPSGRTFQVPGFFAGDGERGPQGDVWCVRFSPPNEPGLWLGHAVLRSGDQVNVAARIDAAGTIVFAESLRFRVQPPAVDAQGFFARGPIRPDGFGRFRDALGGLFVKAGVGSPENLLGYAGFHGATDGVDGGPVGEAGGAPNFLHTFGPHVADWRDGDPDWGPPGSPHGSQSGGLGRGIVGALNALADMGANALYIMPMNLGGDGRDTFPFASNSGGGVSPVDPDHVLQYDVRRLHQWNAVLSHAQGLGLFVQLVLAEREPSNIAWLGDARDARRRLFLKQMVAHFGHLPGLEWTLCEENAAPEAGTFAQFTPVELAGLAAWIRSWDVDAHPRSVHVDPNDLALFEAILDDGVGSWVEAVSLQVHGDEPWSGDLYGEFCEQAAALFLNRTGRRVVVNMDEPGFFLTGAASELHPGAWAGVPAAGAEDRRRRVLYDSLLSGAGIAWYFGLWDLANGGGDLTTEDFRTRERLLRETAVARRLVEQTFSSAQDFGPADQLWQPTVPGARLHPIYGNPEILAAPGGALLAYFPSCGESEVRPPGTIGPIDLNGLPGSAPGAFEAQWIEPKTGASAGAPVPFDPTLAYRPEAPAPAPDPDRDWLLVLSPR